MVGGLDNYLEARWFSPAQVAPSAFDQHYRINDVHIPCLKPIAPPPKDPASTAKGTEDRRVRFEHFRNDKWNSVSNLMATFNLKNDVLCAAPPGTEMELYASEAIENTLKLVSSKYSHRGLSLSPEMAHFGPESAENSLFSLWMRLLVTHRVI